MRDIVRMETERLELRRLQAADAPRIARFTSDPAVARMLAMVPLPNPLIAVEGWLLIRRARASERDHVFAVELPGEGLIGVIGVHAGHPCGTDPAALELGYWFGRPYWGQGFASESVSAVAAEAAGLGVLEAGHFVDNPASGRVLEKAGFAYTGEEKPQFSLARGEKVRCLRMRYQAPARHRPAMEAAHLSH